GNNRIVILDKNYDFVSEIVDFNNNGQSDTFNNPQGIFVTANNHIYIADTENRRIIQLDDKGELIKEIGAPESDVIRDGFKYHPVKISVDSGERVYVRSEERRVGKECSWG